MIEFRKRITRQMLKDEPEKLFVFGDNLVRKGFGGQAKAMRGEKNAVGIPTKKYPSMQLNAFLSDSDYKSWLDESSKDFLRLLRHDGIIIWPENGIGTGLAKLEEKSPKIFLQIEHWFSELNDKER